MCGLSSRLLASLVRARGHVASGPSPVRAGVLLLALVAPALSGCGQEPSPPPAIRLPADPSAGELLASLLERLKGGSPMDREFTQDAARVQGLLWPDTASEAAARAATTHRLLLYTAGGVAGELAAGPGARAEVGARDPISLELHDAWLAAASQGPDAYRTWCGEEGPGLVRRLEAARQAQHFGRPPR